MNLQVNLQPQAKNVKPGQIVKRREFWKYHSKNYGLVMTGQAIGGPVSALLTQVQSRMIRI